MTLFVCYFDVFFKLKLWKDYQFFVRIIFFFQNRDSAVFDLKLYLFPSQHKKLRNIKQWSTNCYIVQGDLKKPSETL